MLLDRAAESAVQAHRELQHSCQRRADSLVEGVGEVDCAVETQATTEIVLRGQRNRNREGETFLGTDRASVYLRNRSVASEAGRSGAACDVTQLHLDVRLVVNLESPRSVVEDCAKLALLSIRAEPHIHALDAIRLRSAETTSALTVEERPVDGLVGDGVED